jgi:hypothetical protein
VVIVSGNALWTALAVSSVRNCLIAGTGVGEVVFFDMVNLLCGPAICTTVRGPASFVPLTSRCACCGKAIPVPQPAAEAIRACMAQLRPEQSLDLPAAAFDDPRLLASCPHCSRPLKFNPFFVERR